MIQDKASRKFTFVFLASKCFETLRCPPKFSPRLYFEFKDSAYLTITNFARNIPSKQTIPLAFPAIDIVRSYSQTQAGLY